MSSAAQSPTRTTRSAALFVLTCFAGSALAEESKKSQGPWRVVAGAGAVSMPVYPGSDRVQTRAIPLLSVRHESLFLGGIPGVPAGLGIYLYEDKTWSLAAVAAYDISKPRQESDDRRLRGMGDIDATARLGAAGSYRDGWLLISASAISDVGGGGQGTVASLDAKATYRALPRLQITAGPGLTWADNKYMRTHFGVDREQAANSEFSPYPIGSGVSQLRFSLGAQYQLSDHWGLAANITAARFHDEAADSPIVESTNQIMASLFFTYRF